MPTITLKITSEAKQLWVEAAGAQHITLSEWLRRAATVQLGHRRLGAGDQATSEPPRSPAPSREASHEDPAETPHGPETSRLEPADQALELVAQARQLLQAPEREFRTDFKDPAKPKKPRR